MNTSQRKILYLILLAIIPVYGIAQDQHELRNEIAIGTGLSAFTDESGFAPVVHLHYSRCFSPDSPFSFSGGFEMIFDEHRHNTVCIGVSYNFWKEMSLGISPGISFVPDDNPELGMHLELSYEFELGKIHLGPMAEYGLGADHSHYSVGIHIGYGF